MCASCRLPADEPSNSADSGYPTNDHFSNVGSTDLRDAQRLGEEAGERDHEERDEDDRVLGLGLDADAVRALEVAPGDRPHDADGEHHAGEVGGERVALVHAAVEELEVVGELVVELQHDGGDEQPQEPEVDARVHDAGRRVAQQGLHPHAGPEVLHAPVEVALGGAAVVGRAPLVVLDPLAHQPRADEQHDRRGDVEGPVDGVGDAAEGLTRDDRVVLPLGDPRCDARGERAERDEDADDEHQVVRLRQRKALHERKTTAQTLARPWLQIRPARGDAREPASSFFEKPGWSSSESKARWPSLATSSSESAITLALRGAAVEEGEVAEEAAGPERRHLTAVALDPGLAVEDHEELGAGRTLVHHHLAGREGDPVGRLRHHLQLLLGAGGEEGHRRQGVDERVAARHGEHPATTGTRAATSGGAGIATPRMKVDSVTLKSGSGPHPCGRSTPGTHSQPN